MDSQSKVLDSASPSLSPTPRYKQPNVVWLRWEYQPITAVQHYQPPGSLWARAPACSGQTAHHVHQSRAAAKERQTAKNYFWALSTLSSQMLLHSSNQSEFLKETWSIISCLLTRQAIWSNADQLVQAERVGSLVPAGSCGPEESDRQRHTAHTNSGAFPALAPHPFYRNFLGLDLPSTNIYWSINFTHLKE